MKQYPRIARLSTVGLRQHQAFDYEFHGFRTDFIGESGCGKSMIADLLQLIIVGSEHFFSATDAMGGPRLPEGMVLRSKDRRGTEIGYACLTIEVALGKFVTIGTYIETTARNTTAFVLQAGYEEEDMTPLVTKLSYKDLMKEGKILPLEELKTHLEGRKIICQSWFHKKGYYKYLFKNKLLSLDLSVGDKIVKDFAAIIRSFSRGKSIDTQKGESLKQFLFGNDAAKALQVRYQESVAEMRSAFDEYGQNLQEIDKITRKQKSLNKILEQEKEMNDMYIRYLYTLTMYTYQEEERTRVDAKEVVVDTETAHHALLALNKILIEQEKTTFTYKRKAEEWEMQCKHVVNKLWPAYNRVERMKDFLTRHPVDPSALMTLYKQRKWLAVLKGHYNQVEIQLKEKGLMSYFTSIMADKDKSGLIDHLEEQKRSLEHQLQEKQSFRQFANINNKGSLGYWALQEKRAFSLEEESILMYFKDLSTRKPVSVQRGINRYLPTPASFLEKRSVTDVDDKGFWLYLNGLREYIPLVEKQIFTADGMENITKFFEELTQGLEKEIKDLQKQLEQVVELRKFILGEKNFDDFLEAQEHYWQVMAYEPDDLDKTSEAELQECVEAYGRAVDINGDYEEAESEWDKAKANKIALANYAQEIGKLSEKIKQLTEAKGWMEIAEAIRAELPPDEIRLVEDDTQLIHYFNDSIARQADKASYLRGQIEDYRTKLRTLELPSLAGKWEKARNFKEAASAEYRKFLHRDPIPPDGTEQFGNGDEERNRHEQLKKIFQLTYQNAVAEFLPNDAYKYDNVFDCIELGHALLPAAFQENPNSENVIESIGHYLKKINDSNRELNKRKLQKIRDLLDDVSDEVGSRLTMAKRIDNFLNDKDKEITGGHRVRLKVEMSRDYPKEWIDTFQHKLNNDANDLISEDVARGVSLEEKMFAAFRTCAPTATVRPKIEKLLDPNAYLEVSFSMESATGQINKGSTGQSYAGIALLCIARLSIIGTRDDRQNPPGIRFMPIDEAEGLGSNYDMLYKIAKAYDYQIISLSINPLGKFQDGEQYLYMLQKNIESDEDVNYPPYAIFCEGDKNRDDEPDDGAGPDDEPDNDE